jgi:hypothetical protein
MKETSLVIELCTHPPTNEWPPSLQLTFALRHQDDQ